MAVTNRKIEAPLSGYETTFITRNELSDEALKAIQERVKSAIGEFGGSVVLEEDWGRRKLAYPIQRETRGHYTYLAFTGKAGVVQEVERNLRISEHVLRFLSVNLAQEFDTEVFLKSRVDAKAAIAKREAEREARREERMAERRAQYDGGDRRDRGDRGDRGGDRGERGGDRSGGSSWSEEG